MAASKVTLTVGGYSRQLPELGEFGFQAAMSRASRVKKKKFDGTGVIKTSF
jgi:hypothetical protein